MASLTLNPTHTGGLTISHPDNFLDITIPVNNGEFPLMWQTMMVVPNNEMINFIPESSEVIIEGTNILTPNQIGLVTNENGVNTWKVTSFDKEPRTKSIEKTLTEDKYLSSGDPTWQSLIPTVDNLSVHLSSTENDEYQIINESNDKNLTIRKSDGTIVVILDQKSRFIWLKRTTTEWKIMLLSGFSE